MKTKSTKRKNEYRKFGIVIIAMAAIILVLISALIGVILYKGSKIKTPEEEAYLSLYPHLMHDYAHDCVQLNDYGLEVDEYGLLIKDKDGYPLTNRNEWQCRMTGYGINEDGEPYVDYEAWNLDVKTTEFISDREEYRITFKCDGSEYCPRKNTKK